MELHFSKYTSCIEDSNELLLYHSLTGSLIRIIEEEKINHVRKLINKNSFADDGSEVIKTLKEQGFLFPSDIDETEIAKQLFIDRASCRDSLRLMIYVTNACNFRCVYCPQPHTEEYMDMKTIVDICEAIKKYAVANSTKTVIISWFGGEPLLNTEVIENAMESLSQFCSEHNIILLSGMTTNGYGLTDVVFERLIKLGVNEYQITLDGLSETHDRNRFTRDGKPTWERIWSNLIYMNNTEYKFSVSLRINVNKSNADSAKELIKLKKEKLDERFTLQIQPITNMGGMGNPNSEYCTESEAEDVRIDLYSLLGGMKDEGFRRISRILRPFGLMCNCAKIDYLIIKTDGTICKCELLIDDEHNCIGKIDNSELRLNLARLAQYVAPSFSNECQECKIFPLCYGLYCPHKKSLKYSCGLKHFDLTRNIKMLATGLIKKRQAEV